MALAERKSHKLVVSPIVAEDEQVIHFGVESKVKEFLLNVDRYHVVLALHIHGKLGDSLNLISPFAPVILLHRQVDHRPCRLPLSGS